MPSSYKVTNAGNQFSASAHSCNRFGNGYQDIGQNTTGAGVDNSATNLNFNNSNSNLSAFVKNPVNPDNVQEVFPKSKSESVGSFNSDFGKRHFVEDWTQSAAAADDDNDDNDDKNNSKDDDSEEEERSSDEENDKNEKHNLSGAQNPSSTSVFHSRTYKGANVYVPDEQSVPPQGIYYHQQNGYKNGFRYGVDNSRTDGYYPNSRGQNFERAPNYQPRGSRSNFSSGHHHSTGFQFHNQSGPRQEFKFGKGGVPIPKDFNELQNNHQHPHYPYHCQGQPSPNVNQGPRSDNHYSSQNTTYRNNSHFSGTGDSYYQGKQFTGTRPKGANPQPFKNSDRPVKQTKNNAMHNHYSRGDTLDEFEGGASRVPSHFSGSKSSKQAGNQSGSSRVYTGLSRSANADSLDSLDDISLFSDESKPNNNSNLEQRSDRLNHHLAGHKLNVPAGMCTDKIKNYYS